MRESTEHLEPFRQRGGHLPSDESFGMNGVFFIPIDGTANKSYFQVIVSDGMGWEHVSAVVKYKGSAGIGERVPQYHELCILKDLFWKETETVMHLFVAKAAHVNNHPHCLHLWRPSDKEIPLPPEFMVGIKGLPPGSIG